MNKYLILGLAATAALLSSCSESNDEPNPGDKEVVYPSGVHVICQGSHHLNIDGSHTFIDPVAGKATQNAFKAANGRGLGATPQCATAYGSKIYYGIYDSNVIEVMDRTSFKSLKQISLANGEGQQTRGVVAHEGKVYFSTADGYVVRLDTLSLDIDAKVKVGPYPEIMTVWKGTLYVPNSDGLSTTGFGRTASCIDLKTFTVTKTIDVPLNPVEFSQAGDDLLLRCSGDYYKEMGAIYRANEDGTFDKLVEATCMAVHNNKIYYVNSVYGNPVITYGVYDNTTRLTSDMLVAGGEPEYPVSLGVNPRDGHIFIGSCYPSIYGYADYTVPGYVCEYDPSGHRINTYDAGVYPSAFFFN